MKHNYWKRQGDNGWSKMGVYGEEGCPIGTGHTGPFSPSPFSLSFLQYNSITYPAYLLYPIK